MIGIIITSGVEGKEPSLGLSAGVGKSTLMGTLAHRIIYKHRDRIPDNVIPPEMYNKLRLDKYPSRLAWEKLKRQFVYFPIEMMNVYDYPYRSPVVCWDDLHVTCSKAKSNSNVMKTFVDNLWNKRPHLAVLIATASSVMGIAKPFRAFFDFEIIVSQRGIWEIQRRHKMKNFYAPETDINRLQYGGTSFSYEFPSHFEEWYKAWREEHEKKYNVEVVEEKVIKEWGIDREGNRVSVNEAEREVEGEGGLSSTEIEALELVAEKGYVVDRIVKEKGSPQTYIGLLSLRRKGYLEKPGGRGSHTFILSKKGKEALN